METMSAAKRAGYRESIVLALENYPINRQIQELGGSIEKRLRLYQYPDKIPEIAGINAESVLTSPA
jgi:hypothetical protein